MVNTVKRTLKKVVNFILRIKLTLCNDCYIEDKTSILHSKLDKYVSISRGCNIVWSEIGKFTYLGENTKLPYCRIGHFCSISSDVKLAAGLHPLDYVSTHPVFYGRYRLGGGYKKAEYTNFKEFAYLEDSEKLLCEIGNDVWIACGVTIVCRRQPIHIGNGAVIAAGAIVTNDVPDYAVVMGCPAKVVRYRFDSETRSRLLESQWWDKDDQWINSRMPYFVKPKVFVEHLNDTKSEQKE